MPAGREGQSIQMLFELSTYLHTPPHCLHSCFTFSFGNINQNVEMHYGGCSQSLLNYHLFHINIDLLVVVVLLRKVFKCLLYPLEYVYVCIDYI